MNLKQIFENFNAYDNKTALNTRINFSGAGWRT